MTIEIVDFFPLDMVIFRSYVNLPEGTGDGQMALFVVWLWLSLSLYLNIYIYDA